MFLNKRPWDNLETPEKIQMLSQNISEIHDYLLTSNQYKHQMELVIEIIDDLSKKLATENAEITGEEEVSSFGEVVHQPLPTIRARVQNVFNNFITQIYALIVHAFFLITKKNRLNVEQYF